MIIQGQVGQPTVSSIAAGANPSVRMGQLGDVIVSELHGRYYETTYRRNSFTAVLGVGTTTSAALAASHTGLLLYNPQNSTVNVVINKVGMSFLVAFAAASSVGLFTGASTTTPGTGSTNITVRSNYVGLPNGSGQAVAYSASTLQTSGFSLPYVHTIFGAGLTGAITTTPQTGFFYDLEGLLVLPPGTFVGTYTSTASGASSLLASFSYEEVPI